MINDLETARAMKAELETKLANATAREAALADQRRRLSFDAEIGDLKARKALDEASRASASIGVEIENLRSAIEEAARRIAAVERVIAAEAARANATDIRARAEKLRAHGERLDGLMAQVIAAYGDLRDDIRTLHQFAGVGVSEALVAINCARAIDAALLPARLHRDHIPPTQRHSFVALVGGWAAMAERGATEIEKIAGALPQKAA